MALNIYLRCSTDHQDYAQQLNTINKHLQYKGINPDKDITCKVVEKVSGTVRHTERKLSGLIDKCKEGDTIYFSELSRLGRSMRDLHNIVSGCCERGIKLIQCKDGTEIEDKSIQGAALLFALSLAAQIEVANLRQRTQSGVDVAREEIKKKGYRITKAGTIQKYWGGEKGRDMSTANAASCLAKQNAAAQWKEKSVGYKWTMDRVREGWPYKRIIEEFNKLHEYQPEVYCTRTGKPLSHSRLSLWISEANLLAQAT